MRSQDGLHRETNSLSLRSGERVRERGAWEIRGPFQAMFSRLSPLPGPLPPRSSRGEGEDEAPLPPAPHRKRNGVFMLLHSARPFATSVASKSVSGNPFLGSTGRWPTGLETR